MGHCSVRETFLLQERLMSRIFTVLLLSCYCYLAAFTTVEGGKVEQGFSGRIVMADLFALGLFVPAFLSRTMLRLASNFWLYAAFMAAMFIALLLARQPQQGIVEYIVYLFNFAVGIALFNLVVNARDFSLSDAIHAFFYASGAIAVLSLLQFAVFPEWFGGRQVGGLVGTFRNTGQAGTYFGTGLALFVPAIAVGLIKRNSLNLTLIALLGLCLILTVKRAALLGLAVGILGMLLAVILTGPLEDRKRNIAFFAMALFVAPLAMQGYDYMVDNVAGVEERFEKKITNFTIDGFLTKFYGENTGAAFRAFEDNPIIGVGPNNVIGTYSDKYEIHSTPLSILAASGLTGFLTYLTFLLHFLWSVWRAGNGRLAENRFMRLLLPMLFGLIVSWGYTLHIRKREFWILYAIVMFGIFLIEKHRQLQLRSTSLLPQRVPGNRPALASPASR
jgi:hypothetical protein